MGKEFGMFADRLVLDNLDEHLEGLSGAFPHTYTRDVGISWGAGVYERP